MSLRGLLRRALPWVISIVAGFLIGYMVIAFFVFPAGVIPNDVRVPNVIGLTFNDAVRQLQQKGFGSERGETRFHNAAPKGTVLDQVPAPGSREQPSVRVSLIVSGGQKFGSIPGIIGMSREAAQAALETAGFDAGEVSERPSNEPRGAVIDSRPRPGTQAPMPSAVALVVSAGPTTVVVPDVVGRGLSEARLLLRQVGLIVGETQWAGNGSPLPDVAAMVLSQSPAAGSEAAAGSRVNLGVGARAP